MLLPRSHWKNSIRFFSFLSLLFSSSHLFGDSKHIHENKSCNEALMKIKGLETLNSPESIDQVLLITPGALLGAKDYSSLSDELSNEIPTSLILSYNPNLRTPLAFQLDQNLGRIFKTLSACSESSKIRFFLAGHSMGGISAQDMVVKYKIDGLILLGSYLTKAQIDSENPQSILNLKLPTLTLAGELDGFTRLPRIVKDHRLLSSHTSFIDGLQVPTFPIVILPGVNHFHFASGKVDPEDGRSNLELAIAHKLIAEAMGAFIEIFNNQQRNLRDAISKLKGLIEDSDIFATQWHKAQEMDKNICKSQMSERIAGFSSDLNTKIETKSIDNIAQFALAKPSIKVEDSSLKIEVIKQERSKPNPLDISKFAQSPFAIACKMKSAASVQKLLGFPYIDSPDAATSCMQHNLKVIKEVFGLLTPKQLERWQNINAQFSTLPDKVFKTGIRWVTSDIKREQTDNTMYEYQLTSLYSRIESPRPFDGMHYCTYLPATRLLEKITLESIFNKFY